jgi:glutamine amidotransferase-like uncharacterized protein
MQIKMLTSWAGDDITARYGETIDLPAEIAAAQVAAGNAEFVGVQPETVEEATEEAKPAAETKPKKK